MCEKIQNVQICTMMKRMEANKIVYRSRAYLDLSIVAGMYIYICTRSRVCIGVGIIMKDTLSHSDMLLLSRNKSKL
jgi:hypothetical protein